MDFNNKIVLISGGSSGLGLATTKAFLKEKATVIVASRSLEKFTKNLGAPNDKLHFIATDFSDMKSIRLLYQTITKQFDAIDIAINNVGYAMIKPMLDCSEEEFDYSMNVNLKSLWLSMKLQIPLIQKSNATQNSIINISSVSGFGGTPNASFYALAKAGVISITKTAALEFSKSNISINCIAPGAFDTPMLDHVISGQAGGDQEKQVLIKENYKKLIPNGRLGDPEEFAETVLWLCKGKATYISGHTLIIDGGFSSKLR